MFDSLLRFRQSRTCNWKVALVALTIVLTGCSGSDEPRLEDFLEELEFDTPLESVRSIQLGLHHLNETYRISIATQTQDSYQEQSEATWVQLSFKMFLEVAPKDEKATNAAIERHQGVIDDVIISTCRGLKLEEIDDYRYTALKSRLIDALQPYIGEDRIRQLTLDDFSWEPI